MPTTFLFTDIAGSTRLWQEHPEAMGAALATHDRVIGEAVAVCGGRVFKHTGDTTLPQVPPAGGGASHGRASRLQACRTRRGGSNTGGEGRAGFVSVVRIGCYPGTTATAFSSRMRRGSVARRTTSTEVLAGR